MQKHNNKIIYVMNLWFLMSLNKSIKPYNEER